MIPPSRVGGLNRVAMGNLNAASAPIGVRFRPKRKARARSEHYRDLTDAVEKVAAKDLWN